jgi:hypothetical protein
MEIGEADTVLHGVTSSTRSYTPTNRQINDSQITSIPVQSDIAHLGSVWIGPPSEVLAQNCLGSLLGL